MAEFVKSPMTGQGRFNKWVMATSASDKRFDSTFEKSVMSNQNCTLRITLRVFFRQIDPNQLPEFFVRNIAAAMGVQIPPGVSARMFLDAGNRTSIIQPWRGPDWSNFINGVKAQAQLWHGKFWLIPPNDFRYFDITEGSWTARTGSKTFRPNVECEFKLEMTPSRFGFHHRVDVVNLLSPWAFRSHSELYDSADAVPSPKVGVDSAGQVINTNQPSITHEIGHLLGLPHIGVSRNLGLCRLAMVMSATLPKTAIPALYSGDRNADVCYGTGSAAGDIHNIMGSGSRFSEENAQPWLDRLLDHVNLSGPGIVQTRANLAKWRVSMTPLPPRVV